MKRSTDRILVTHVGSLPRPDDLLAFLVARDRKQPYDRAAFQACLKDAVAAVVAKQVAHGVDIVNDGELGKIGYGAYAKERLTGFDGEDAPKLHAADLDEFPIFYRRLYGPEGFDKMIRPQCTGPISYVGQEELATDIANLKAALAGSGATEGFLNATSPGAAALWLGNAYYKTHEEFVWAIAEAMQAEYEAITAAGFVLQIDSPDLGMGRHMQFQHLDVPAFRKQVELHLAALNHATRNIAPERMRMHLCWGNYDGPHHHDIELKEYLDLILTMRPLGLSVEGANPRHEHEWRLWQNRDLGRDIVLLPGVLNSVTHRIEHPELIADRLCRYAEAVGRENVIASTDCGMSSQAGHVKVDPDIGWAKYRSMAEGARLATRRLWG
ncbi:MAG: cobalamin-independent methionine synthase II family protein [Hyphomicrobiaceae bacterium]